MVDLPSRTPAPPVSQSLCICTLGYGVDLLAVAGELLGSRLRFDIQAAPATSEADAAPASRLILRASIPSIAPASACVSFIAASRCGVRRELQPVLHPGAGLRRLAEEAQRRVAVAGASVRAAE